MTRLADLPIRVRVTAAFGAVMLLALVGVSAAAYIAMGSALLDEIDTGLRFRAASLAVVPQRDVAERVPPALDEEPGESFDQLLAADGTVLRSSPAIPRVPLLNAAQLRDVHRQQFFRRHVPGVADEARLLAVPLAGSGGQVLVVGSTMSDRTDALRLLTVVLSAGGAVAVALACLAGWYAAGLALRPMERIRRQASAITASGLDRRLELPRSQDEVRRLAETLNDLLQRLDDALAGERQFLEQASHELRTPLAALRAELDLAGAPGRTRADLAAAVTSAAEETERLVRLANDLLGLARAHGGTLPVRREDVDLRSLVSAAVALFGSRAAGNGIALDSTADDVVVRLDPQRVRQALDNLLDNAVRHTPTGGSVAVAAVVDDDVLTLSVTDDGPGFDLAELPNRGLGLRIAQSVAAGHGGELVVERTPTGGARVAAVLRGVRPEPVSSARGSAGRGAP